MNNNNNNNKLMRKYIYINDEPKLASHKSIKQD